MIIIKCKRGITLQYFGEIKLSSGESGIHIKAISSERGSVVIDVIPHEEVESIKGEDDVHQVTNFGDSYNFLFGETDSSEYSK